MHIITRQQTPVEPLEAPMMWTAIRTTFGSHDASGYLRNAAFTPKRARSPGLTVNTMTVRTCCILTAAWKLQMDLLISRRRTLRPDFRPIAIKDYSGLN